MKLRLEIRGIHCSVETKGFGSDEVGFFLSVIPIATGGSRDPGRWTYGEGERSFRVRHADDVDSGEDHTFQYPISVETTIGSGDFNALEVLNITFEVDGSQSTESKVQEVHDAYRSKIERNLTPGRRLGTSTGGTSFGNYWSVLPTFGGVDGTTTISGKNADSLIVDGWHISLDDPLRSIDWDTYFPSARWTPETAIGPIRRGFYNGLYRTMRTYDHGDHLQIERRHYRSEEEGSSYEFDVRYSLEE